MEVISTSSQIQPQVLLWSKAGHIQIYSLCFPFLWKKKIANVFFYKANLMKKSQGTIGLKSLWEEMLYIGIGSRFYETFFSFYRVFHWKITNTKRLLLRRCIFIDPTLVKAIVYLKNCKQTAEKSKQTFKYWKKSTSSQTEHPVVP